MRMTSRQRRITNKKHVHIHAQIKQICNSLEKALLMQVVARPVPDTILVKFRVWLVTHPAGGYSRTNRRSTSSDNKHDTH